MRLRSAARILVAMGPLWVGIATAQGNPQRSNANLVDRIYFESSTATLSSAAQVLLQSVAGLVSTRSECGVRLVGRTDPRGGGRSNRRLSDRRTLAVADELARLGVDRNRIEMLGQGEAQTEDEPDLSDLPPEEQLARQRRVDVFIGCPNTPPPAPE